MPSPSVPASACRTMRDTELVLLWGFNPGNVWLAQAQALAQARARGAKLMVIDPVRTRHARDADLWLQLRPGTDAALALGLARELMHADGWDEGFVRQWTNACFLVREDTGRWLTARDLDPASTMGDRWHGTKRPARRCCSTPATHSPRGWRCAATTWCGASPAARHWSVMPRPASPGHRSACSRRPAFPPGNCGRPRERWPRRDVPAISAGQASPNMPMRHKPTAPSRCCTP